MAKRKKHGTGNGKAGAAAGAAFVADLASNVIGQAVGQLVADGVQRQAPALFGGPDKGPDVATRMLLVLTEQGPRTVAQLIDLTDAPVQSLLDAIAGCRRAKLIGRIDKAGVVRVTEPGRCVAETVRRKLEQEGRAAGEESSGTGEG